MQRSDGKIISIIVNEGLLIFFLKLTRILATFNGFFFSFLILFLLNLI